MASTLDIALASLALRVYATPGAVDQTDIEKNRPAVPTPLARKSRGQYSSAE